MSILVTGGAGFIGSHIVRELLDLKHDVIVLDDLSGGFTHNLHQNAIFVRGSITDSELVNQLFNDHKIEYVFHCAAYAAEVLSHHIRKFNYENNVIGSANLINAAINHDIKCFVFISSAAIYGENQTPYHEGMFPAPTDPYGIAKLTVELDLKAAEALFKLPYIIYRLHNVYGENQNISDKYRNVIAIFMNQLLKDEPLTVFGDGTQTRAFTYIGDIAPLLANSINRPEAYNEIFNLGTCKTMSINELACLVASVSGVQPKIVHLSSRHEIKNISVSHEKIRSVFGELPQTPLEIGIKKMHEWVKLYGPRLQNSFNDIEILKNLPSSWRLSR